MIFTIFIVYILLLCCSCMYPENRQHDQAQTIYIIEENGYDSSSGPDELAGFGSD